MVTYIVGTDGSRTSDALCEYLEEAVAQDDTVHAVYALGANPEQADIDSGEDALSVFSERLGESVSLTFHRPIRSTPPAEELLITANEVDADRIVVGLRQHSAPQRVIFGSTAQKVLRNTTRPVVAIPL